MGAELSRAELEQRQNAALRHGARSNAHIVRRSTVQKRRLLRQLGLRQDELESVGIALLNNWARAAAALSLLDDYAAREGWLDEHGEPRGFARLYIGLLNAERLALGKLGDHLRADARDPFAALEAHLREKRENA